MKRSSETVISLRLVIGTVSVAALALALLLAGAQPYRAPSMHWLSAARISARYHQLKHFVRHAFDPAPPAPADTPAGGSPSATGTIDGR